MVERIKHLTEVQRTAPARFRHVINEDNDIDHGLTLGVDRTFFSE
jgi:hypothetical protein